MLYLIGLGLWNENDIPLRGIEAMKKCDIIYCEFYTNKWTGDMNKLEEITGNKITAEKLKESIELINNKRKALKRLSDLRANNPSPISAVVRP